MSIMLYIHIGVLVCSSEITSTSDILIIFPSIEDQGMILPWFSYKGMSMIHHTCSNKLPCVCVPILPIYWAYWGQPEFVPEYSILPYSWFYMCYLPSVHRPWINTATNAYATNKYQWWILKTICDDLTFGTRNHYCSQYIIQYLIQCGSQLRTRNVAHLVAANYSPWISSHLYKYSTLPSQICPMEIPLFAVLSLEILPWGLCWNEILSRV
jgi:hypothetical protein